MKKYDIFREIAMWQMSTFFLIKAMNNILLGEKNVLYLQKECTRNAKFNMAQYFNTNFRWLRFCFIAWNKFQQTKLHPDNRWFPVNCPSGQLWIIWKWSSDGECRYHKNSQ